MQTAATQQPQKPPEQNLQIKLTCCWILLLHRLETITSCCRRVKSKISPLAVFRCQTTDTVICQYHLTHTLGVISSRRSSDFTLSQVYSSVPQRERLPLFVCDTHFIMFKSDLVTSKPPKQDKWQANVEARAGRIVCLLYLWSKDVGMSIMWMWDERSPLFWGGWWDKIPRDTGSFSISGYEAGLWVR